MSFSCGILAFVYVIFTLLYVSILLKRYGNILQSQYLGVSLQNHCKCKNYNRQ